MEDQEYEEEVMLLGTLFRIMHDGKDIQYIIFDAGLVSVSLSCVNNFAVESEQGDIWLSRSVQRAINDYAKNANLNIPFKN